MILMEKCFICICTIDHYHHKKFILSIFQLMPCLNLQFQFGLWGYGGKGQLVQVRVFLADPDPATAGGSMGGVSVAPSSGGGGAVAPLTGGSNEAFAVGDSITVGCQSYLEQNDEGWKFTVDARVSRPTPEGIEHIKSRNGTFGSVVVVNLGTNAGGQPYAQQAAEIEQLLSSVPRIVWVTVDELSDWQRSVNVEIHNIATRNNRYIS